MREITSLASLASSINLCVFAQCFFFDHGLKKYQMFEPEDMYTVIFEGCKKDVEENRLTHAITNLPFLSRGSR